MTKIFLTFANKKLWRSSKRIIQQAKGLNYFDKILNTNEDFLQPEFIQKHFTILNEKTRGFGYWIWKPRIILNVLSEMNDGDILLYTDAGCHLNKNGIKRLNEYFNIVNDSNNDILPFRYDVNSLDTRILKKPFILNWENKKYITKELLQYFNLDNDIVKNKNIVAAGILFVKKSKKSLNIINEWLKIMEENYSLYDGTFDSTISDSSFITSRHDQSVFTLLCEKYNIECLSGYEHYFPINEKLEVDWSILNEYPIHAKRDKDFGFIKNIIEKINYKLNHAIL